MFNQEATVLQRLPTILVALTIGVFGAACASGGTSTESTAPAGAAGQPSTLSFVIDNNVAGADTYVVFVIPEAGGVRQQIGQIEPGEMRTFRYNGQPGNYTLAVQGQSGTRTSSRFRMYAGSTATWRLDRSQVSVTGGGG